MSISPTSRTLAALRNLGLHPWMVERWIPGARIREDLFNIIDIIALDHGGPAKITDEAGRTIKGRFKGGVIGVQSCGQSFSAHWRKLTIEKAEMSRLWLETNGCSLQLWGWRRLKVKRGGKAMKWTPRVKEITLSDLKL